MKILGVLVQNDEGKIELIEPKMDKPNNLKGSGIRDVPTPKDLKFQEDMKVKEVSIDTLLSKYRGK